MKDKTLFQTKPSLEWCGVKSDWCGGADRTADHPTAVYGAAAQQERRAEEDWPDQLHGAGREEWTC